MTKITQKKPESLDSIGTQKKRDMVETFFSKPVGKKKKKKAKKKKNKQTKGEEM